MLLESKEIINRPLKEVFELVRDDIEALIPYMPNVSKIVIDSREEVDGGIKQVNTWYANAEIPGLLKKFLKPELLSWKDYANWKNSETLVDYELESVLGNDLFDAHGVNSFKAVGDDQTELTVSCNIKIYAAKVPGVPRILARKATPLIEGLLEKILAPNLTALGTGLNSYFEQN